MPLALADLLGRLPLRDHPLLCLLQCDQPVAVPLCHEKCPCIHLSRLAPSIGHFYLAQLGHYHLAATHPRGVSTGRAHKSYAWISGSRSTKVDRVGFAVRK